jgi:Icc-related predicted phosphoesterase
MKIHIVSDLHLDMGKIMPDSFPGGELLILAGDITEARSLKLYEDEKYAEMANMPYTQLTNKERINKWLMEECGKKYKNVIYVLGNHEHYHETYDKTLAHAKKNVPANFHFLEQDHILIDDTVFLCATLWTDMNRGDPLTKQSLKYSMNDFMCVRKIKGADYAKFTPSDAEAIHHRTLQYFKTIMSLPLYADKKIVVVSHHAPCSLSIAQQYKADFLMNGGFYSELSEFILDHPRIQLWIHGHTHTAFDYMIGDDTRVVCNPRGYKSAMYDEYTGWDPLLTINI